MKEINVKIKNIKSKQNVRSHYKQNLKFTKNQIEEFNDFKIKNFSLSNEPTKRVKIISYGVRK